MPALTIFVAIVHLLAMAMGLYAVLTRATGVREGTELGLQRALRADVIWGLVAIVIIGTGLYRLLGGLDGKLTAQYMKNPLVHAKLTLVVIILALEVSPMLALMRVRAALMRGEATANVVPPAAAKRIAIFSHIQALCMVIIVCLAASFARGRGFHS